MRKVLTQIEKLDGSHPGIGTKVRVLLDSGIPVRKIPKMVQQQFGVSVTKDMVGYYRTNRWAPLRDRIQAEAVAVKSILEAVGGDAGVDEFMSARLLEQVRGLTHDELIEAKELFVKIRAQNLKEHEFLFKTGQLKHNKSEDGGEGDADAEEAKTKRVMNKIRGIFGLDPLPDETGEPETEAQSGEVDEASQASQSEIEPSVDEAASSAGSP